MRSGPFLYSPARSLNLLRYSSARSGCTVESLLPRGPMHSLPAGWLHFGHSTQFIESVLSMPLTVGMRYFWIFRRPVSPQQGGKPRNAARLVMSIR